MRFGAWFYSISFYFSIFIHFFFVFCYTLVSVLGAGAAWCCFSLVVFFSLEFWRECKTITICRSHLYMSSHCTHLFSHKHRNVHRPKCRIALNRKKNEFNIDVCRCSRCTFKHTNSSVSVWGVRAQYLLHNRVQHMEISMRIEGNYAGLLACLLSIYRPDF